MQRGEVQCQRRRGVHRAGRAGLLAGPRHVGDDAGFLAVRDAGRDSVFKPKKANIGPRKKEWKPTESNTQQPHRK